MGLVTRAEAQQWIWGDASLADTTLNALLDVIIEAVSDRAEDIREAPFAEAARTEYLDGDGGRLLYLENGPLVSVAGVWLVAYSDGGGGARAETLTEVKPFERLEGGLRADGCLGAGCIVRAGKWPEGDRNIKVTATCGFSAVPDPVKRAVLNEIVYELQGARELGPFKQVQIGDMRAVPLSTEERERAFEASIAPYRIAPYRL